MNEHDKKSENSPSDTSTGRREFLTAVTAAVAAGAVGGLATEAQAQPTFQAAPMSAMRAEGTMKLSEVSISEMPLKGNMAMRVSPATASLLKNLSSSISSTIHNSPAGASADYVQYGWGSSIANASHQELVVR